MNEVIACADDVPFFESSLISKETIKFALAIMAIFSFPMSACARRMRGYAIRG